MLDVLTKWDGGRWNCGFCFYEPRLPKALPDIACATTTNGCLTMTTHIYIYELALGDLERLEFHW